MVTMKRLLWALSPFAAGALLWLTLGAAGNPNDALFPSISVRDTNFMGEAVITNGATLGGVRRTTWPTGGGAAMTGTVSNNVASGGLLAVDTTKTNGIAATYAHITNALGFIPATNGVGGGSAPVGTVVNTTTGTAGMPLVLQSSNPTNAVPSYLGNSGWKNVLNYGVKGDAIQTTGSGTNGNSWINLSATNSLTSADIGKWVSLLSGDTAVDFTGYITGVTNGTNIAVSSALPWNITNAFCTIGTSNTVAFQSAINAASGGVLYIPPGNYLVVNQNITDYGTLSIPDGSLTIRGDSSSTTKILGNGAWRLSGGACYRGYVFLDPGTAGSNSVRFENLTIDGGVQNGSTATHTFPASATTGAGWDVTHGAYLANPSNPHNKVSFNRCDFQHFRGEMIKDNSSDSKDYTVDYCLFYDGNASGFNSGAASIVSHSWFQDLYLATEQFIGFTPGRIIFSENYMTNCHTGVTINGASTNNPNVSFLISGNHFEGPGGTASAILMTPAKNVSIIGNAFHYYTPAIICTTSGYQGNETAWRDILVEGNQFFHVKYANELMGAVGTPILNYHLIGNTFVTVGSGSGFVYDSNVGYFTNLVMCGNRMTGVGDWVLQTANTSQWQDAGGNTSDLDLTSRMNISQTSLTNSANEVVATNGMSLGGVRITAWPSVTGSTTVTNLTITNNNTSVVPLTINHASGATANFIDATAGGTNTWKVDNLGRFLFPNGTAAKPAIGWLSDDDGSGTGIERPSGNQIGFSINGTENFTMAANDFYIGNSAGRLIVGTSSASTAVTLERDGAAGVLQIESDSATPTAAVIKAADATGSNGSGAPLTSKGGQSTGSGVPGDLIYQTSLYTNATSSTANAYNERARIVGRPSALTNTTATSFQRFTMATNTVAGIRLFCSVQSKDAAFARQSISSEVRVDAVNVNGTITATVSETDNTIAASTGTLTVAYTVADEGSNVLAVRCAATTSLTPTELRIKWAITTINSDGAITVTPVQL